MIILSDNTATNILIDLLSMEKINKMVKELGMESTQLRRKMIEIILDILKRQQVGGRLNLYLPEDIIIAHKTGDLDK